MGGPLLLYFPGKEPPHKEFLGSDPNGGDLGGISLCLCAFFALEWQNGHCVNGFLEACYRNNTKAESNNKIAQSPRKQFPESSFAQSTATISCNLSENNSSIMCLCMRFFWMESILLIHDDFSGRTPQNAREQSLRKCVSVTYFFSYFGVLRAFYILQISAKKDLFKEKPKQIVVQNYSQLRQNHLKTHFQPKVGKELPEQFKGQKKHMNFFNINFSPPTRKPPFWAPRKRVYVPHFLGRTQKKGPAQTFSGGFWGQKGGPKRASLGHKKFCLLFFSCPYHSQNHFRSVTEGR